MTLFVFAAGVTALFCVAAPGVGCVAAGAIIGGLSGLGATAIDTHDASKLPCGALNGALSGGTNGTNLGTTIIGKTVRKGTAAGAGKSCQV